LGVSACATAPRAPAPVNKYVVAQSLTSPALCYVNYAGDATDKAAALHELASRNFLCQPQHIAEGKGDFERWQAMRAEANAQAAARDAERRARALDLGLRLLTPPPPPRAQQCQWQTNANGTGSMVCF
jgi:hypothetical protein